MSSSSALRKESPAIARVVTNRRRQRTNATTTTASSTAAGSPSSSSATSLIPSRTSPSLVSPATVTTTTSTLLGPTNKRKPTLPGSRLPERETVGAAVISNSSSTSSKKVLHRPRPTPITITAPSAVKQNTTKLPLTTRLVGVANSSHTSANITPGNNGRLDPVSSNGIGNAMVAKTNLRTTTNGVSTHVETSKPLPKVSINVSRSSPQVMTDKSNGIHQEQEELHPSATPWLQPELQERHPSRTQAEYNNVDHDVDDTQLQEESEMGVTYDDEVQDVEPVHRTEIMDATCLWSGALVSIRSASPTATYLSVHNESADNDVTLGDNSWIAASLREMGMGRDTQVFRLEAVAGATAYDNNLGKVEGINNSQVLLRYGGIITLTCPAAVTRNGGLGVRVNPLLDETTNAKHRRSHYQVGMHGTASRAVGLAEQQWTILAASARRRPLWVGPAARLQHGTRRHHIEGSIVRAGDAIALRNCATGGLLSLDIRDCDEENDGFNDNTFLTVVTDSYGTLSQQHQPLKESGSQQHQTLLNSLQQHDRMFPTDNETFQLIPAMSPPCPPWARRGLLFYSGSYLLMPERNETETQISDKTNSTIGTKNADAVSVQDQERILLDEVIGSLIGLEGLHVCIQCSEDSPNTDEMEFRLVNSERMTFHLSLRTLVERILPLSTAFVQIRAFVVRHSTEPVYGSVMQALCQVLDGRLQEHVAFVHAQLDQRFRRELLRQQQVEAEIGKHNTALLTMKHLFSFVQSAFQTLLPLQTVCARVSDKKGGFLLNEIGRLKNQSYAGDGNAQRVMETLLVKASVPYMEQLQTWLQTGRLDDPYEEFLVQRVHGLKDGSLEAEYDGDIWDQMYVIRNEHVLSFDFISSEATLQKILRTGKYWNAVGAVGRLEEPSIKQDGELELSFLMDSITFLSFVDSMYQSASHALVRLIRNDFNLFESMRTMKRYFLLDQGDFFVNFLDSAEEELSKRADQVSLGQIQHWLGMSIQLCETTGDRILHVPNSRLDRPLASPLTPHSLRCRLAAESLSDHLKSLHGQPRRRDSLDSLQNYQAYSAAGLGITGVEAFVLAFRSIPFPTSLIISPKVIAGYQLLFRHLFIAKHIERRLVGVWRDQQVMKKFQSLRQALGPTNFLGQRMLHFSQNLIYYMMFEVIEPNWLEMSQVIFGNHGEQTVDSMIDCHNNFLRRTLDACLLTNYDFVRILTKLMTTCLRFADQMKHFVDVTGVHEDSRNLARQKRKSLSRNPKAPPGTATKKSILEALVNAKEESKCLLQEQTKRVNQELMDETFRNSVARFEHNFSKNLGDFMQLLRSDMGDLYHSHRLNLLIRLDYNGFVTRSIDINNS